MHVSGFILDREMQAFQDTLDSGEPFDLITNAWEGQVTLENGDWEGPVGWDAKTKQLLYKYSFDLVSTGLDEENRPIPDGIISPGSSSTSYYGSTPNEFANDL
ncbi:hypothetical protein HSR121_2075 [Halapricum desulfuricans]|uniref:Uncharacterized protein n=2 Tax=Halapricum desulfuricans TaxID=2841257 RepID=A0A897N128_9EURY|nr:hypothetical protein HSR121_2075 [Halapricum desulfuricans]